ncbi:hypothetical protein B8W92_02740 [Moraxella osloensis]|nr:hypothetical protein [Moraxella osloensis]PAL17880.1 hypothetical protein B8W92_02740 [Moraxella osloensis]
MALINIKRFLNISEIADYLNSHGENYDMNESYDRNRLNTTIMDLVFERKLTPLFFYSGNIRTELEKREVVGDEPWETAITEQKHLNQQFNDYLKITDFQIIKELISSNYDNYVNIQQVGGFDFYKLPYEIDKEEWFYYFLEISKDFSISFYDLRFPRIDLDKIFNVPDIQELQQANLLLNARIEKATQVYFENQQLITHLQAILDSQTKEIADLKAQLKQQANQPSDTPATGYTTTAITALNHVIAEFWQDWEIGKPPTKQEYIIKWITDNYPDINPTMAKRIEQIARHETAK